MEKMLNEMIDAGLEVKFCSRSHVQVFPKGSSAWFFGDNLEEVHTKAVDCGYISNRGIDGK